MAKHYEKKLIKNLDLDQELEKEYFEVKKEVSAFYPNNELAISDKNDGKNFLEVIQKKADTQMLTEEQKEQIENKCFQIRSNVKDNKPGNIEINLIQGNQKSNGCTYDLGNTVIKAVTMDFDTPVYSYFKKGESLNSLIFLGGDDVQAFLVTKNEDGKVSYVRLSEFHLLSISENSKPDKEIGLMTSYVWLMGKIDTSVILGNNLCPIKNLFFAEWFRNKNEVEKKTTKKNGSDIDGE